VEVLRGSGIDDEGLDLRGLEVVVQVAGSTKGVVHDGAFTTKIIHAGGETDLSCENSKKLKNIFI